jgi:hypothetical protein
VVREAVDPEPVVTDADRLKALTAALRIAADVLAHLDEQEGDMQASVQFAQAEIRVALEKQP